MGTLNTQHNRACWFDIPVADLDRAITFYSAVLGVGVSKESIEGMDDFGLIEHDEGNGGCIVVRPEEVSADKGMLLYFNVDGRIRDAAAKTEECGGKIVESIHSLGSHGFRALILDSEGNRCAIHSESDE